MATIPRINLVKLGQRMMSEAPGEKDDKLANDYSRVGELLILIGSPFNPRNFGELSDADQLVARTAATRFLQDVAEKG